MSRKGDRIDRARARLSARAERTLSDLCTFYWPGTEAHDSRGELTTPDADPLEDVPCELQPLSNFERLSGGETTATATSKLKLPANADTLLIDGSYRGVIQARGVSPERSFDVTGQMASSADVWLILAVIVR
jgi:hypothetical protein